MPSPNGCMIAEVEVDPETGVVKIDRVCSVDDAGVAINPLTLDGQYGSLTQAVGEMLAARKALPANRIEKVDDDLD
jgi:aerobic carbon-monoxide dehydrogenase large subunit